MSTERDFAAQLITNIEHEPTDAELTRWRNYVRSVKIGDPDSGVELEVFTAWVKRWKHRIIEWAGK